jgi:hypothetical protein
VNPRRGRPLVADHERFAREYAARALEHSIQTRLELARYYRSAVRFNVDQHAYQAAGLFRRVAEFLEGELWPVEDAA